MKRNPKATAPEGKRGRQRLDLALVERGLTDSRATAQKLILAGEVRVDGERALRASQSVGVGQSLEVLARPPYVSRGGDKLAAALAAFPVDVHGRICADVGSSTGGFTDCLLQHGATKVYAIDVGHGILHWKLRQDPRVIGLERTNARHLAALPEPIDIATIDVAFISLRLIFPVVRAWLRDGGEVLALVKPQFEAGRGSVGSGGVVRDPSVHRKVLQDVMAFASAEGLGPQGVIRSPLRGPSGNVEFFLWARPGPPTGDLGAEIERAMAG